jgi:APA family basic amino acid/polyamine antiporter
VVAIKVAIVVLVIGFGAFYITADYWHPFIPENTGVWGQYGWSGIIRASGIIFFAYIGFDAVSTAAQEAKNPQRDVPFGILASLIICTILYILMSGVLTGMLAYPQLNDAAPVAPRSRRIGAALADDPGDLRRARRPHLRDPGHDAGAVAHLLFDVARLDCCRRASVPAIRSGRRRSSPRCSRVSAPALMGGLLPLNVLGELVSSGTLLAFVTVCIGIMVLRVTRPDLPRPFKVKGVWFVGIGGTVFCGIMLASLFATGGTWYRIVLWTILGFLVYFGYGYKHSALRNGGSSRPIGPASTQLSK